MHDDQTVREREIDALVVLRKANSSNPNSHDRGRQVAEIEASLGVRPETARRGRRTGGRSRKLDHNDRAIDRTTGRVILYNSMDMARRAVGRRLRAQIMDWHRRTDGEGHERDDGPSAAAKGYFEDGA